MYILAANAQWDKENRFDGIIADYLSHVTDEKPITARQCVKALAQVGLAKSQYIPRILSYLQNAESDISTKDNLAHLGIEYLITAQTEEVVYSDSKNLLSVNKYYFPITRTNRTYISTAYSNIRVDEFTMGNHGEFYVLFFLETFDNIMISEPGTAPTEKQKELFEELFLIIDFIQSN